jgi:hypothetical protein
MDYKGKLYGRVGGKNYFDTGKIADDWDKLEKQITELKSFTKNINPFTGDMWQFLLVNALRFLTEEQRAGLCFDLYCRSEIKELIDGKIQDVKSEKLQEEMERCKNDPEYFYKTYWEVKTDKQNS